MTDDEIVRAMLCATGISPSSEEIATLVATYPQVKAMVGILYGVDAGRNADMCLTFQAEPVFTDWS